MPDDRVDSAGHITMKQNEQRRYGNDWCKGQRRTHCTKYDLVHSVLYFVSQVKFCVTNMNKNFL